MRFPLTAEQEAIRTRARALADNEFRERAARWDEREEYPWDNVKQLVEAGLMGMTIPAAYGGQGKTLLDVVLAIEQVARVCGVTGRILVDSNLGPVGVIATTAPRRRSGSYLPRVVQGDKPAIAITEPAAGSAASDLETRAERERRRVGAHRDEAVDHGRGRLADLRGLLPVRRHPGSGGDRGADRRSRHPGPGGHAARAGNGDARHPGRRGRLRRVPGPAARTFSSPRAASGGSWPPTTASAWAPRQSRSGSPRGRSKPPSGTPGSASSSAGRSGTSRGCAG